MRAVHADDFSMTNIINELPSPFRRLQVLASFHFLGRDLGACAAVQDLSTQRVCEPVSDKPYHRSQQLEIEIAGALTMRHKDCASLHTQNA